MTKHTAITQKNAIHIFFNEVSQTWDITRQPVNQKTGKPWQAQKWVTRFSADQKAKAYKRWLEETNFWRKAH